MKITRPAKTLLSLLLLSALLLLAVVIERPRPAQAAPRQSPCPSSWQTVSEKEFAVSLPQRVKPKPSFLPNVLSTLNPAGTMYRVTSGGASYTVRSLSIAGGEQGKMKTFRDVYRQSLVNANGDGSTHFVPRGQRSLDGATGEQYEVRSAGARGLLHLYVRDGRLYTLEVMPASANGDADCFLNSFTFKAPLQVTGISPRPWPTFEGPVVRQRTITITPTPTPLPPPLPPPPPTPTPTPPKFRCDCGDNVFAEVDGDERNHPAAICPRPKAILPNSCRRGGGYEDVTPKLLVNLTVSGTPVVMEFIIRPACAELAALAVERARTLRYCVGARDGVAVDTHLVYTLIYTGEVELTAPAGRP